jgi:peptidyl-prolyl cis-trans isomerase D
LNEVFKKEFNFSPYKIKSYYNDNMEKYEETYKSIEFLELSPKKLTDNNEFNEIFYEKINEIDNLIIQGENLEFIIKNFNLGLSKSYTLDKLGRDLNSKKVENLPEKIEEKIFNLSNTETTALMEFQNKYFLVEIIKTENIQKNFENEILKKSILAELQNELVRKEMSKIISKINQNNFKKIDFEKISNEKKVAIQKISLKNSNDNKILKSDMVKQIYDFPEKMVIVVNSFDLSENFLIYIDKVINVTIEEDSKDYTKYFNLSKIELANILFDTYDDYIKQKYEIEINYKALDTVKRYFN